MPPGGTCTGTSCRNALACCRGRNSIPYVFAVIGFAVRQAEHAFLQNGIFAVPQRYAEAQQLITIADTGHPIFAPVIGTGTRLVVSEIIPGIAILAVVFANRTPLTLAQVGAPFSPGLL